MDTTSFHFQKSIPNNNAHTLKKKMLGCFNPNLGQIWTNPNVGLKYDLKNVKFKVKVEDFKLHFLTQHLGLSIFDPNLG